MSFPKANLYCIVLLIIILTGFHSSADAQIRMKGTDYKLFSTLYTTTQTIDSVFILNNFSFNRPAPGDTLIATFSSSSVNLNFEWRKLDAAGKPSSSVLLQTNGTQSSFVIPSQGGFQVHITGTGLDTVFRAWVFFASKLSISIDKTADGKVKEFSCSSLLLKSTVSVDTFTYADPSSGESLVFSPDNLISSVLWATTDGNTVASGKPTVRVYSPPTTDTRYALTVKHVFGNAVSDYVDYLSVIPKADFSYQAKDYKGDYVDVSSSDSLSAIATLQFTNKSINAQRYTWIISDTLIDKYTPLPVEIDTTLKAYQPEYSYYIPRAYSPLLIAINNKLGCRDTAKYNAKDENTIVYRVLIGNSKLKGGLSRDSLPNVFSPNGDGTNDYFRPYMPSIKNFKFVVYNRLGRKIYEYKHDPSQRIDEWMGWDGKTSSGSMVEPGIYYYVIEAVGWDGVAYRTKKYSSALAIYR
jgi:gliding motility-associated-like protein